jgi:uncharacterized DUF497 family protein
LDERQYQFEWDEIKAGANVSKHGIPFELASTVFADPALLTVADLEQRNRRAVVFGRLGQRWQDAFCRISLVGIRATGHKSSAYFCPPSNPDRDSSVQGKPMSDQPIEDDSLPTEVDFSKGVRGLHHIPPNTRVFLPASIERSVWQYFSARAQKKGVDLSDLLTDVLKRDIEINEALK